MKMHKISPFLWFDNNAEEAAHFYASVFENARTTSTSRYTSAGPGKEGSVMVITMELAGQEIMLLNGGPAYQFTEAISLMVTCDSQQEIDLLWERLTAGGEAGPCGWLKDKYGVSWQIAPRRLMNMIADADRDRANRVIEVMLKMNKLELEELESAYAAA
jgi:predicted 3-demethylubiquinone-9 3-methyltransferase (glyoxalase superfamily)